MENQWQQRAALNVVCLGVWTASHITKDMLLGPYSKTPEELITAAKKCNMCVENEEYLDDGME